jgi:hypothetical protein
MFHSGSPGCTTPFLVIGDVPPGSKHVNMTKSDCWVVTLRSAPGLAPGSNPPRLDAGPMARADMWDRNLISKPMAWLHFSLGHFEIRPISLRNPHPNPEIKVSDHQICQWPWLA